MHIATNFAKIEKVELFSANLAEILVKAAFVTYVAECAGHISHTILSEIFFIEHVQIGDYEKLH